MKGKRGLNEEQALKTSNAGRGIDRGRWRFSRRGNGKGKKGSEFMEYYKCHKVGHYKIECPSWVESENYAEYNEEE